MNFEGLFQQRIETLHREGRYRVFAARGTERMRLTPSPAHSDEQMAKLIRALDELWAACPVSNGTYVRLAAE